MSTRSRTLRNTWFSTVGLYTEFALGMLTSIVIARHLGPHFFGAYSGATWLMAMAIAVSNAGTASAAIKFIAELRGSDGQAQILPLLAYLRFAQRRFLFAVLAVCTALLVFAGDRVTPSLEAWIVLAFLLAIVPLRAAYMFNIGTAKGFEEFRANAVVALVAAPINLALVLLVSWLGLSVYWQLGVFLVSSVLFWAMSRRQVAPLLAGLPRGEHMPSALMARVRHHMLYSALTVAVGFVVGSEAEVLFLNLYRDEHGAGQFKVAYQLAFGAAALVPGVFGALLLPMMASALSQGRAAAGARFAASTGYLMLLAAPLVGFGWVFSSTLVQVLYGSAYREAGPLLAVCLLGTAFTALSQGGSSLLISADRQRSVLVIVIACGLLKLGLDWSLIHHGGLQGAAAAFVIVCVVQALCMMALAIHGSGRAPDWSRLARIAVAAGLAALVVSPLHGRLVPVAELLLGGLAGTLAYACLVLVLGCLAPDDIAHLQQLHARLRGGGNDPASRLLSWAYRRAESVGARG